MRTTTKSFRRNLLLVPLLLALAGVAAPAMADGRGDRDDRRGWWHYHDDDDDDRRRWDRHDRRWDYADRRHDRRYDHRYDHRYDRRRDRDWDDRDRRYHPVSGRWDNGRRGPPPWARGRDYRGYGYRNVYYVPVEYYPRYRLYRPPHGYRWVRDDHDNFLLVAATTGIISQILSR